MHRVELKVTWLISKAESICEFLMHRVELKGVLSHLLCRL